MARHDVYPMPGNGPGYVLDVQADLLSHLATRVVVPLLPERQAPAPINDLNPIFDVEGERHVMVAQALSAVHSQELRRAVASLADQHDRIIRALDVLLVGY